MKNILVVDDNGLVRQVLELWIRSGIREAGIFTAGDGREALEIMKSEQVSLVLTDLQMPVMNGYELIERCRAIRPDMPVYVMTGERTDDAVRRLARMGVRVTFEKPFDFDEVVRRIRDALGVGQEPMDMLPERSLAVSL